MNKHTKALKKRKQHHCELLSGQKIRREASVSRVSKSSLGS